MQNDNLQTRIAAAEAVRAAARELDAMVASWGASEEESMCEYKDIRRASRENTRSSR